MNFTTSMTTPSLGVGQCDHSIISHSHPLSLWPALIGPLCEFDTTDFFLYTKPNLVNVIHCPQVAGLVQHSFPISSVAEKWLSPFRKIDVCCSVCVHSRVLRDGSVHCECNSFFANSSKPQKIIQKCAFETSSCPTASQGSRKQLKLRLLGLQ